MIYEKQYIKAANELVKKNGKDISFILSVAKGLEACNVNPLRIYAWCKTGLHGLTLGNLTTKQEQEYKDAVNEFKKYLRERN